MKVILDKMQQKYPLELRESKDKKFYKNQKKVDRHKLVNQVSELNKAVLSQKYSQMDRERF